MLSMQCWKDLMLKPRIDLCANDWRGSTRPTVVPRVTVQVVTKDRPTSLYGFLSSLICQTYQDWDLIIVDDSEAPAWRNRHSTLHRLLEILARLGHRVRAFHTRHRGIDRSYDVALVETESELALREEDDHILEAGYIEALVQAYDMISLEMPSEFVGNGVGAVGAMSLQPGERLEWPAVQNPPYLRNYFSFGVGEDGDVGLIPEDDQRTPIMTSLGAFPVSVLHGMFLYNVHAVRQVGGFATVTNGWRGETATTLQLGWLGYSMWVCPQAVAYHLPGRPAAGSHRGIGGDEIRSQSETEFQAWLSTQMARGRPVLVDLDWARL